VDSVAEDSPAADAGIKKGDIIYEIDGRLVSSMDAYQKLLSVKETGDEVRLLIYREKRGEGTEKTIEVVTGDNRGIR
jgi:S1-C subfamily serine protease